MQLLTEAVTRAQSARARDMQKKNWPDPGLEPCPNFLQKTSFFYDILKTKLNDD